MRYLYKHFVPLTKTSVDIVYKGKLIICKTACKIALSAVLMPLKNRFHDGICEYYLGEQCRNAKTRPK